MLTCGLVPLPVGDAKGSGVSSLEIGMDPEFDYDACWEGVYIDIALGTTFNTIMLAINVFTMGGGSTALDVVETIVDAVGDLALAEVWGMHGAGERRAEEIGRHREMHGGPLL